MSNLPCPFQIQWHLLSWNSEVQYLMLILPEQEMSVLPYLIIPRKGSQSSQSSMAIIEHLQKRVVTLVILTVTIFPGAGTFFPEHLSTSMSVFCTQDCKLCRGYENKARQRYWRMHLHICTLLVKPISKSPYPSGALFWCAQTDWSRRSLAEHKFPYHQETCHQQHINVDLKGKECFSCL